MNWNSAPHCQKILLPKIIVVIYDYCIFEINESNEKIQNIPVYKSM